MSDLTDILDKLDYLGAEVTLDRYLNPDKSGSPILTDLEIKLDVCDGRRRHVWRQKALPDRLLITNLVCFYKDMIDIYGGDYEEPADEPDPYAHLHPADACAAAILDRIRRDLEEAAPAIIEALKPRA